MRTRTSPGPGPVSSKSSWISSGLLSSCRTAALISTSELGGRGLEHVLAQAFNRRTLPRDARISRRFQDLADRVTLPVLVLARHADRTGVEDPGFHAIGDQRAGSARILDVQADVSGSLVGREDGLVEPVDDEPRVARAALA